MARGEPNKTREKGFTLLELIVVIIIIGILASLGYTQYSKMVEYSRGAEARTVLGAVRKRMIEYWHTNGTFVGIQNVSIGVGSSSGQIPSDCVNTFYYSYGVRGTPAQNQMEAGAWRCISGGKPPQGDPAQTCATYAVCLNMTTGGEWWQTQYSCNYVCP